MSGTPVRRNAATLPRRGVGRGRWTSTRSTSPDALTTGFIRSYAIFWVLGLGFLWWPALLIRALRAHSNGRSPRLLPLAVAVCLSLSLLWALLAGASLSRVVSASYNLTIWITLAVLTTVSIDPRALVRGVAQLAGLQSVAVLAALGLHPLLDDAPLPSAYVLPAALAQDPAFESFTTVRLVTEDYFGGMVLRTAGFFGNSTWAGVLAALGILATIHLLTQRETRSRAIYSALLVVNGVVLFLSYSRNTWVAVLAALLAMSVLTLARRGQWFALMVTAASGIAALLYVLTSVDLAATFEDVNSVREGSLDSRTAIYDATWQAIVDLPFPLIGSGVKERVPGLVASLGTHSGYLGILYRGGWLAIAALLLWLLVMAWRSALVGSPLALGSAVLAMIWFIAEDVDAGHLAPLAFVLSFALIDARRQEVDEARPAPPTISRRRVDVG